MWADEVNKLFYLYGGEYDNASVQGFGALWFYDTIYNTWNLSSSSNSSVSWPAFGAGTTSDDGIAYYYGGYLNDKSVLGWDSTPLMLNSMVSYDMNKHIWENHTYSDTPRAEGSLQYIPAGEKGMLVYFGGVEGSNNPFRYVSTG